MEDIATIRFVRLATWRASTGAVASRCGALDNSQQPLTTLSESRHTEAQSFVSPMPPRVPEQAERDGCSLLGRRPVQIRRKRSHHFRGPSAIRGIDHRARTKQWWPSASSGFHMFKFMLCVGFAALTLASASLASQDDGTWRCGNEPRHVRVLKTSDLGRLIDTSVACVVEVGNG